jgi:hypothetical protein
VVISISIFESSIYWGWDKEGKAEKESSQYNVKGVLF